MTDGYSKQILLNMIFNYTSPMKKGFDGEIVASLLPINQKFFCLDPTFFWTKNSFGHKIFLDKIFFGLKTFWTQNCLGPKICFRPNNIWTQYFLDKRFL